MVRFSKTHNPAHLWRVIAIATALFAPEVWANPPAAASPSPVLASPSPTMVGYGNGGSPGGAANTLRQTLIGNGNGGSPTVNNNSNPTSTYKAIEYTGMNNGMMNRTNDQCGVSAKIDGSMGCDSTYNTIQAAQIGNMVSQAGAGAATTIMGQQAQMKAYSAGSTSQADAMDAAATLQKNTGITQVALGSANALVGALQLTQAMGHNRKANQIQAGANGSNLDYKRVQESVDAHSSTVTNENSAGWVYSKDAGSMSAKIVNKFDLNRNSGYGGLQEVTAAQGTDEYRIEEARRNSGGQQLLNVVRSKVQEVGGEAQGEQKRAASAAMAGGMMSLMTGGQQIMSGSFSMLAAKQLQDTADKLRNKATATTTPVITPGLPTDLSASGNTVRAPSAITGTGTDSAASDASADTSTEGPPDMGSGFNPAPLPSGVNGAPEAGKFNQSMPGNSGGGGGGAGMGGGGTTAAAQGGPEDPQAKLAPKGEGDRYESGGGGFMSGGGAGKGAEGGPDLSGLLEKFLPKKEDANQPTNNILDFGGKSNAADAPLSALDKNANIFTEVSKTYQNKTAHGEVGI